MLQVVRHRNKLATDSLLERAGAEHFIDFKMPGSSLLPLSDTPSSSSSSSDGKALRAYLLPSCVEKINFSTTDSTAAAVGVTSSSILGAEPTAVSDFLMASRVSLSLSLSSLASLLASN